MYNFIISLQYSMPLQTEQQMKALNRSQLTEYIKLLHKDNEYIGQLAVDSKSKLQRVYKPGNILYIFSTYYTDQTLHLFYLYRPEHLYL